MNDEKIIKALDKTGDIYDVFKRGIRLLEKEGHPLSDEQKKVLWCAVAIGHKNDSDTWDHQIYKDQYGRDTGWNLALPVLKNIQGHGDAD